MANAADYQKPIPIPDEASKPFFEGARQRRLMIQQCSACGAVMWPVKSRCNNCLDANVTWVQARGKGTLYSFALMHQVHLFDCCLVSNGGIAVVITSAERAKSLKQPPVYVLGMGQGAPGDNQRTDREPGIYTGAKQSGATALKMAGVELKDIDICELYDCYTYTVLVTLEDYGFCKKGEGGAFVSDGKLGPGGALPTNTGGGELSAYYMWGFTPLSEAVVQARGQGGARQVEKNDLILVSGNGGVLNYHSTTILSKHPS